MSIKLINRLIFFLTIAGLAVSAFLAYEYSLSSAVVCPLTGLGCEIVRKSVYSSFLGVSLPFLGLAYYLVAAVLTVILIQSYHKQISLLRLVLAFLGFGFGVYLTYLEAMVIKAYCIWCLSSFMISIAILLLAIKEFTHKNKNEVDLG